MPRTAFVSTLVAGTWLLAVGLASGQLPRDILRERLKDKAVRGEWVYDDLDAGFAQARRSGKPMLVVVRCVPCVGYHDIDEVVTGREGKLAPLLDRFVCVRLVQGWGLDLSLFQFDYDINWVVFFLNADRTIYGRYGTRGGRDGDRDVSVEGFRRALEGALELHAQYPANRAALAAKTGPAPRWKQPQEIPLLPDKVVPADGTRSSCIHCHVIPPGQLFSLRKAGEPIADNLIWPYPKPDVLGLCLDVRERATVSEVLAETAAQKAGFRCDDRVVRLEGQPILSIADVQWVLHQAPARGVLTADVLRDGQSTTLRLPLEEGWRRRTDTSWRDSLWPIRFGIAGMRCRPVPVAERAALGIGADRLALRVEGLVPAFLKQHRNENPMRAGVRTGDVIVTLDARDSAMSEADYLGYLLQRKKPGELLKLAVMRDGQRLAFEFPVP